MITKEDLEEAKKDIKKTFWPDYPCYNCYMILLYLCVFWAVFPLIFVKFSECFWIIIPLFIFFCSIIIYIKYHQVKEFKIITNIFYQTIRIIYKNKLGNEKEIKIPLSNGCFRLTKKGYDGIDFYKYRVHIWNNYDDNSELDLEKKYIMKIKHLNFIGFLKR